MPVNWVDGVTPVNAANLETMEADTAAKQALTEKAAANGYAPLDGTAKVPLVHLPPVSGVDYIGTWGSGIAYKRGDVVRYGLNDYLAVNDSTGVPPPAAYAPPLGGVSIGTSLPATPYDGQEFVLTDSLTAPTYSWRFRYTASITDANKWVFIGGVAARHEIGAEESTTTTATYLDLTTVGPRLLNLPAGLYDVLAIASYRHTATPGQGQTIIVLESALNAPVIYQTTSIGLAGQQVIFSFTGTMAVAAGGGIRMRYASFSGGTAYWAFRSLAATPKRVA